MVFALLREQRRISGLFCLNLTIIPRNQQKCDTKFKWQLMDGDTNIIETNITKCSAERADSEKDVEVADSYITVASLNDTEVRHVVTSQVPKLLIESGTWGCSHSLCIIKDNNDIITYWKCRGKRHYSCTNLPVYQISLFFIKVLQEKILV